MKIGSNSLTFKNLRCCKTCCKTCCKLVVVVKLKNPTQTAQRQYYSALRADLKPRKSGSDSESQKQHHPPATQKGADQSMETGPDPPQADANKILEIIRNWNGARGAHSHRGAVFYVLTAFGCLIPLSLKSVLERLKSGLFGKFDYFF